ncbi:hypothetical protein WMW72_23340 [Paenibacillus filicis]|uniref:Uncharacterized protein n=1 Tax=Paenibacillus filicis TaxID=669464 RepID=A0ABU9DRY7_9BACL
MKGLLSSFEKAQITNKPGTKQLSIPLAILNVICEAANRFTGLPFTPDGSGCSVVCPYGRFFYTSAHGAL